MISLSLSTLYFWDGLLSLVKFGRSKWAGLSQILLLSSPWKLPVCKLAIFWLILLTKARARQGKLSPCSVALLFLESQWHVLSRDVLAGPYGCIRIKSGILISLSDPSAYLLVDCENMREKRMSLSTLKSQQ